LSNNYCVQYARGVRVGGSPSKNEYVSLEENPATPFEEVKLKAEVRRGKRENVRTNKNVPKR